MSNCINCEPEVNGGILTVTEAQQPFCEQCGSRKCGDGIVDSLCVIYHPDNDVPSKLENLNLPNGSSAELIFETIDDLIGNNLNISITPQNTLSIEITASGAANHTIKADLILSEDVDNILEIKDDGLFALNPYKVKINASDTPDFLINQLVGGTDGIVSTSVIIDPSDAGLIQILPQINIGTLVSTLCASDAFQSCISTGQVALSAVDSASIDFTTSGTLDHTITGNVKISADSGNNLELRGDGLFIDSSTLPTANNGLTAIAGNIQLGGPLIQNTVVSGQAYNLVLDTNTVQIGDVNTPAFAQPSPYLAGQNRKLNVFTKHDLKTSTATNTSVESILTLQSAGDINTTHQFYAFSGAALFDFHDNVTMGVGAQSGAVSGQIALTTRNNAVIGFSGGPISGINAGIFLSDASLFGLTNTGAQGTIASTAGLRVIAPTILQGASNSNVPSVTNYYGIHIGESDNISAKTTNRFGIYQLGSGDINRFFGPVQNSASVTQFTSDERVKENIEEFTVGLKELKQINTKKFNYTYSKNRRVVGVIAQELEKVVPEAVERGFFEVPGGESYDDFRMVDQNTLFYVMLNAIKELSNKVEELEKRLK